MRRRDVLKGAGLAVGASLSFPAPAIAQGVRSLTMVTDYPEGPGMLPSARRLAQAISESSDGRLRIEVSASGEVVRPFQTFEAVQAGVADMFHSHIGYFEKKSRAFHFYSGVPCGLTPDELFAWVRFGGGQDLWDRLAGQFGIKPLLASSTGPQMGGWFTKEMSSTEDFKGLRYRMAEPGAEVFRQLGATVVLLPGIEIVQSLRSGAIEACEWIGPWMDMAMGLHEAATFYYYPGWQEPGTALALGINSRVWESFEASERRIVETAAAGEYAVSLAEFNTNNALALRKLRENSAVQIRRFNERMLKTFTDIGEDVVAEIGSGDDLSRDIYRSYLEFRSLIRDWTVVTEGAYLSVPPLH